MEKTPNVEHRTPNVERRRPFSEFGVRSWMFDVGRLLRSLKSLNHNGWISRYHDIRRHAFGHNRSRRYHRVFANRHTFQNDRVHADPDIVGDLYRKSFELWARWSTFEERRKCLRVNEPLRGFQRMKIGIRNADVPRDKTVRSDFDLIFGHDESAIQQRKITNGALAMRSYGERTTGVTGNVITNYDGTRFLVAQMAKDLCALAIKSVTEFYTQWDRLRPPVTVNMSIGPNVAHVG
jgi:hypothetical protein